MINTIRPSRKADQRVGKQNKTTMKNQKLILASIICSVLIFLAGCKKEEVNLIVGTWHIVKLEERTDTNPWQEITSHCRLDNTEVFEENGNWTLYDGPNQCSPGPDLLTGTWELRASDTRVIFTYDDALGEYESTIETLSEDVLVLSHGSGSLDNTQFRTTFNK